MTLTIRVESAQQTQTDQWQRVTAQTGPRVLEEERRKRDPLRRSFQLDEWEVPAPRQVTNVQFDPLSAATSNLRLRPGTRRAPWPMSSRFKPWLSASRPSIEVDLVRRRTIESVVRSVAVVPVRKELQLPAKGVALVGDQQEGVRPWLHARHAPLRSRKATASAVPAGVPPKHPLLLRR